MRAASLTLLLAALGCGHDPAPSKAPPAPPERWAATLVQGANFLDFTVVFTGPTEGHLIIGNGHEVPIVDVAHTATEIHFTLEKPKAPKETWEHYDLARTGDTATGTSTIGAASIPARMVKLGDQESPRSAFARPQEVAVHAAKKDYQEQELVVDAPDGGKLAGTLTVPAGAGPFPVVVMLSGSGQEDRDETIYGHKPYLLVADKLARAGIASYRFDDRGTGATVGAPLSLDTEIADAGAAIDALKKQPKLDPARVGIIGHSAAGAVAPSAAVAHPVAFIVLLAGTTTTGVAYSAYQTERALRATGADEAMIAKQNAAQAAVTTAALAGKEQAAAALRQVMAEQLTASLGRKPTADEIEQAIAKPLADSTDPWTVSYFRIDPAVAWNQLPPLPVLLLVGDKDTQVPADLTTKALLAATNSRANVTAKTLPGLNHLFQHATTGETTEYLTIDETMDPAALDLLATWIAEQTKPT